MTTQEKMLDMMNPLRAFDAASQRKVFDTATDQAFGLLGAYQARTREFVGLWLDQSEAAAQQGQKFMREWAGTVAALRAAFTCETQAFEKQASELAADKHAAEELAAEKRAAQKLAAAKRASDKRAAQALAAEKLAADKLVADKAAAERLAAQKLAADKLAAEKLAAEKLAAEKLAAQKVATEKLAAEKLIADKPAGKVLTVPPGRKAVPRSV